MKTILANICWMPESNKWKRIPTDEELQKIKKKTNFKYVKRGNIPNECLNFSEKSYIDGYRYAYIQNTPSEKKIEDKFNVIFWSKGQIVGIMVDVEFAEKSIPNPNLGNYNIRSRGKDSLFICKPIELNSLPDTKKIIPQANFRYLNKAHLDKIIKLLKMNCKDEYKNKLNHIIDKLKSDSKKSSSEELETSNKKHEVKYWVYAPGSAAKMWEEFYEEGIMAIGWDELEDLAQYKSKEEIRKKLKEKFDKDSSMSNNAATNYNFKQSISIGDIIIVKKGRQELLGYGIVTSDYYYDDERGDYKHCRKVDWKKRGHWNTDYSLPIKALTDITDTPSEQNEYDKLYKQLLEQMGVSLPINIEKYLDKGEEDSKQLGSPFDKIFTNYKEALTAFDLFRKSYEKFGVTEPGNIRFALTYAPSTNILRLNAGSFAILHYRGLKNNDNRIGLSLFLDNEESFETKRTIDPFKSFDETIRINEFSIKQYQSQRDKILEIYYETIDYIKEYISDWEKSPYRKYNREKIVEAVFEEDKRAKLLSEGLGQNNIEEPPEEFKFDDKQPSITVDKFRNDKKLEIENLYFNEEDKLIDQIHTALKTGKHIILNGPPGTGKSKLARQICEYYSPSKHKMATATSDWSTFDTIGGLMPENNGDKLKFNKGLFLECFQTDENQPDNKWLLLDEINRADIDKAFGALFSALTGDKITLPQEINGKNIKIIGKPDDEEKEEVDDHKFFIHPDWRIIATMNTFDKTSLYEMSYAFMRRFAFINIGVPDKDKIDGSVVEELLELWGIDNFSDEENLAALWRTINNYREIGPSIVEDIAKYIIEGEDTKKGNYVDVIGMYVLPQFAGLQDDDLKKFYHEVDSDKLGFINNPEKLKKVMSDFFEIDPKDFKNE